MDLSRHDARSLDERLRRWVAAGAITDAQARQIARFEEEHPPVPDAPSPRRLPVVVEALAYLGILLVVVSGTLLVVRSWSTLRVGGRVGVGVVVAVLGLVPGVVLAHDADAGARRLGGFLALCGTGGVAIVAGVATDAITSGDAGAVTLVVGASVAGTGGLLWSNRPRLLAFASTVAGIVTTAIGLAILTDLRLTPTEAGLVAWVAGLALAALGSMSVIAPAMAAQVIGSVGALAGALAIADAHQALGITLGLVTAVAALGAGVATRRPELAGVGVVGFLIFLARTLSIYVQGTISAIVVLAVGIAIVAAAMARWRGARPR